MRHGKRIRLCMKDLYHQDVVEMIERETRKYEIWSIDSPSHPDFKPAYDLLWAAFGPQNEMEPERTVRKWLREDPFSPVETGTYIKYFMIVARGPDGGVRGVRDGCILVNQEYDPDLCVVYLAHIYMLPEARGTVLSYWLRISPVELAMQYLKDLHDEGLIKLPAPDAPGRHFGMRINLTAEMEYFAPEDRLSLQRILFYGRGGFDVIDPRHFPYLQPDFRTEEEIEATGYRPIPFMILLRRMGRERQARLDIEEAAGTMRLLYDEFASFCDSDRLAESLDRVLDRLDRRQAQGKDYVDLLPMPTGPQDLRRLRPLWRYRVYKLFYPDDAEAQDYMARVRPIIGGNRRWLTERLEEIAATLEERPPYVYQNRDRGFTWEGVRIREPGE
ncbi:MAG TPA: hypothetical protein PKA64_19070 [Myxococcota bacterium]|nr:hypothetical protein [Myxococcota bacterium]